MKRLGSELVLGILVVTLSIFTAANNYAVYKIGGVGGAHTASARQLLADANARYDTGLQLIILDYTMFDGFYISTGLDDVAANYYESSFSDALKASMDRNDPFDKKYYDEMYALADEKSAQAAEEFAKADHAYAKESVLQLAMLIAALGLAFAAYASLLKEDSRLRPFFALLALIMLIINISQSLTAYSL
ncbi:MAG: hypothetical protein GY755_19130 [Chloroflexi bacterium]|nr:hypothetical protein [Chloroflexota bacterium]